jgi:xylulokinase
MPAVFCGIDVGTQGARCVLARDDGTLVGRGECAFHSRAAPLPEGWFEQEPGSWLVAVATSLRHAMAGLGGGKPLPDRIAALSVTSTSGTLCVLGPDDKPLVPAIMYSDSRARRQAQRVQEAGAGVAERLGYRFGSSFALPKALWLKEERPDVFESARRLLSPADYVIGWLTGDYGRSDETNVLKWGYDLTSGRWPEFIEADLGIPLSLLPAVQKPGRRAGAVTRERARELGLPEGLPVAVGMTDGCASQVSSGAVRPGQYATTIGTTMVVKGVSEGLILDPAGRVYCHRHPEGWWLPGGASNTGAECLAAEFGPEETVALSARALANSPTGLIAYPLVGKGERFPFARPDAERFLLGRPRDRAELFAAYLEGVACLERLSYETLEELGARVHGPILSAGGGARSDAWLQIRADTLNRPVQRPAVTEAAMGAAILAASMERFAGLSEAAAAMVRIETEVSPRERSVGAYGEKYAAFRAECVRLGYLPAGPA